MSVAGTGNSAAVGTHPVFTVLNTEFIVPERI
ncbi:MAG: hypothetical protein JWM16_6173, partial [Verrucomicrobiales bacterium]|nr:hypothetical protein [Verrucomicrobiales bacterium]